ncbi:hypothetical protein [Paenibacillus tundrae]|uniref:Uncharacterized protein n=1 Tax=Paenibacillus tundrae TaxID=528187 RepID=A0ABT9W6R2_9BACL|nr:hypothetical protein [Paenibacillus tundrae]MDQ0168754.1 hypothetical protein [Paenibacillus tundrae]
MNINAEVYGKMRIWENIRGFEIEERKRILSGKKLEANECDFGMWADDYEEEHRGQLLRSLKSGDEIKEELRHMGVDVECIVTSFNPSLRRGFWLYNYYIEEVKVENQGYIYQTYEQEVSESCKREYYGSIEEAISVISSYYHYLSEKPEPIDEVVRTKWDIIR